jgi:predicted outer membrane repeat protein
VLLLLLLLLLVMLLLLMLATDYGGAVYCKGELLLSHGEYTNNTAGGSGGAFMFTPGSNVKAWQLLFAHNTAQQYGGSISADYGTSLNISFSNFTGQCVCAHAAALICY